VVQLLVDAADYRIVPLPVTRAVLLDNLQDDKPRTAIIDHEFLERTLIPANSYFTTRGFPEAGFIRPCQPPADGFSGPCFTRHQ